VCLILLEEKVSARKDLMFKERNDLIISDGFIQLASKLPFLEGNISTYCIIFTILGTLPTFKELLSDVFASI
jgi:hypothetical protein